MQPNWGKDATRPLIPLAGHEQDGFQSVFISSRSQSGPVFLGSAVPLETISEGPCDVSGSGATRAFQNLRKYAAKLRAKQSHETAFRPAMSSEEASRAAHALSALTTLALFPKNELENEVAEPRFEEDGDDSDSNEDEEAEDVEEEDLVGGFVHWKVILLLAVILLSLCISALGIVMQILPYFHHALGHNVVHFRLLAFLGGCLPTYMVLRKIIGGIFVSIELYYYRDSLSYLSNLKHATVRLVFAFSQLLSFHLTFDVFFCYGVYEKICNTASYQLRAGITEKCFLCAGLFFSASWLACVMAKLLSTHFYKSTHFKKFKEALNREYILHALSMPKRKAILQHQHSENSGSQQATLNTQPLAHVFGVGGGSSNNKTSDSPFLDCDQSANQAAWACKGKASEGIDPKDCTVKLIETQLGGMAAPSGLHDTRERPNDQLTEEMIAAVPLDAPLIAEDEEKLERLRTAVVVKTYSKLMHLYNVRPNAENDERMLRRVKAFSKALFKNMAWNGHHTREYVTLDDFELFFEANPEGKAQAKTAFQLFDKNKDGRVTSEQTMRAVMGIFDQRATIASSLSDTDSIVQSLESGFAGGLHFLTITFYLLIWKINLVAGFTTFSAIVVGLSFVFGNSFRIMFESLLFLFGEHPYDVGDWVEIDGAVYEIRKVRLLYTVMINSANRIVYISSKELLEKRLINLTRSASHVDYMFPEVDAGVAKTVKTELKARMDAQIAANPTEYQPPASVILKTMANTNLKVVLQISFTFNFPADDFGRTLAARDSMVQIISDTLAQFRGEGLENTTATIRTIQ